MSNEHKTDNEHDDAPIRTPARKPGGTQPPRHVPATGIDSKAKSNARLAAETRRVDGNEGKSQKGSQRNEPDQQVHQASQEHVVHDENTDREVDDLYRTEGENEVTEWRRHSALDAPPARPGYMQRFIRVRLGTTRDTARFQAAYREGWRPVKASNHTDRSLPTTRLSDGAEVIGVEDLILCEMPERVFRQREAFYQSKLDSQNEAIERQLRDVGDKNGAGFGPIEQNRKSSVSVRAFTPGRSRGQAEVAGDE